MDDLLFGMFMFVCVIDCVLVIVFDMLVRDVGMCIVGIEFGFVVVFNCMWFILVVVLDDIVVFVLVELESLCFVLFVGECWLFFW